MEGKILDGRYKIIRKIGAGGMAQIYLGVDQKENRQVAVKFLSPDQKDNYATRKRFLSEIEITKKIVSPHVVRIYDARWDEEAQYIVMEYIDGDILKNYIGKKTRLTVEEAIEFAKQLALGFDEIHRRGIVHRDIKSSNIMIGPHGQTKIIDFGIAITEESERLTKTDSVIGSIQYMAPEILNQLGASVKSDIYAFGILMFEMLTGSVPFKDKDVYQTAMKHRNTDVPRLNKIIANISPAVSNIVAKAVQRDPKSRYDSMQQIYKDLVAALEPSKARELNFRPAKTSHHTKTSSSNTSSKILNSRLFLYFLIAGVSAIVILVIVLVIILVVL